MSEDEDVREAMCGELIALLQREKEKEERRSGEDDAAWKSECEWRLDR